MTTLVKNPPPAGVISTSVYHYRCFLFLLLLVSSGFGSLSAQCTFTGSAGTTLSEDYDTNQGPYSLTYATLPASLATSYVTATSDATIEICFYGDMNNDSETWSTVIEGVTFASGAYGRSPTVGDPFCQIITLPEANLNSGLSDGDLDISFSNFGTGWTAADNGDATIDLFNAFVRSVRFDYEVEVSISSPADQCQDGTDVTFSSTPPNGTATGDLVSYEIFPATPGFNTTTGAIDVSAADPGQYIVRYNYEVFGCSFFADTDINIFPTPVATVDDQVLACGVTGINLTSLFTDSTTEGGTFTTSTAGATINGNNLTFDGLGCVNVTYTLPNVNGCNNTPYSDDAFVFFPERVAPNFQITSSATCWDGTAPLDIVIDRSSPDYVGTSSIAWSAEGSGVAVSLTNPTADVPLISVSRLDPAVPALGTVRICLEETVTTAGDCTADFDCNLIRCRDITISSFGCNEDCTLFDPPAAVCPIQVNSSFGFSIFGISFDFGALTGFDLYEASVVPGDYVMQNNPSMGGTEEAIISCIDDGLDVSWDAGLNDALFPAGPLLDDPILEQIGAGFICDAAMFSIPFPAGFCGDCGPRGSPNLCVDLGLFDPCILVDNFMPLSFLNFEIDGFGTICSITPRTLIVDPLQQVIESTSVAVVWADTDGDGAFDTVLEQGGMIFDGSAAGTAFVPNNVQGEGVITVRNLAAAIKAPYSPCVSPEGTNLIDLLPIDFIPVAGPIIRQALTTAGLNINIAPSDYADLPITVQNDQDPQFLNFPTEYVFASGTNCSSPATWSAPIAIDACTGLVIEDVAQTGGPVSGEVLAIPNPNPVDPNNPNLYRVEYTATACNGQTVVDSFDVFVSVGDPLLSCPETIVLPNDIDQCGRVVTGLTPLQGLGCKTTITWTAPGATPNAGTDDASGTTFPAGTTTVTYTMTYVDAAGATQTQTCDFDVIIEDLQKPSAQCRDVEVRLDDQGQAIVTVADIEGGSTDNCTPAAGLDFSIARTDMVFGPSVSFDCFEEGQQTVILRVRDTAENDGNPMTDERNERRCLALVTVTDYFEEFTLTLDVPELCLEANNEEQLDFGNYLTIAHPDGTTFNHLEELGNGDDIGGVFGITGYNPSIPGSGTQRGTSVNDPGDAGFIDPLTGVYTPGTGTGFVTISYVLGIGGQVTAGVNQLDGCFILTTDVFELRQPLAMDAPECMCIVQNDRIVELGEITGGLEPYTIQYSGVKLDVDNDGIADDQDGEFMYLGDLGASAGAMTFDTADFAQDLGSLLVDYTQPTWSFTIVDARGCELFRSGSCDNDDENGTPEILCEDLGPVSLFTEESLCEAQYTWAHPLPTDNCDVILYTYTITNPDGSLSGPFDLTALLNPDITNPDPEMFNGVYEFQHVSPALITSTVTYYAEDAVGNFSSCSFDVSVEDDDKPFFLNCVEPAVIVNAIEGECQAFANYSLPLAGDNCSSPIVTQVDMTGLVSGDLYPVGITINTFEAVDETGNKLRCDVKVIVNDIFLPPSYDCPDEVTAATDPGDCGAIIEDIAPTGIEDNCLDNLTVIYRIDDADGNLLSSGFDDASGTFFDQGTSTVSYATQDMPLLLITEITHDLGNTDDGNVMPPAFSTGNPADGDYLEITNFNRAVMDVSCLMIERIHAGGTDSYAVPTFTYLEPGGTLTIHFGDGTNSPADNFFNVPGAENLPIGEPAAYVLSLSRAILDVAAISGYDLNGTPAADYWSGTAAPTNGAGIVRTTVWDTNTADDFMAGAACQSATFGALNPGLAQPVPNGAATAIQAQPTTRIECAPFTVTVNDDEAAVCGLYGEHEAYIAGAIDVAYGDCIETVYTVTDDLIVADVNLNLQGMAGDMGNLTFTLISPEGTEAELATGACPGTNAIEFTFDGDFGPVIDQGCGLLNSAGLLVMPAGDIEAFNGESMIGDWTLRIGHNGQQNTAPAVIASTILFISSREAYPDYTAVLENDPGVCGADYSWQHAILFDNCPGGSVLWEIIDSSGSILVTEDLTILPENTDVTFFFPVGINTVRYTLTDGSGNSSSCAFDVTVDDTEPPVITCPADVTIQLAGGECEKSYRPSDYTATDNCGVVSIFGTPPFHEALPIGVNDVLFSVVDAAGNTTTCTYTVTIVEYEPALAQMACIEQINVHIPGNCEQLIIADMVLAGDEYYCYDNYELRLLQRNAAGDFDTLATNLVGIDQIGGEIRYQVYDPRNDVSCWGRIDVGFFSAPEFICPEDTIVSCNAATDVTAMGSPTLLSCALAGATVAHADTLQRNEACDDPRAILRRTWKVTDAFGNSSSCVQTITIEAFDLATVRFPADLDGDVSPAINCVAAANDPTLTDPENTGFPFVDDGANIFTTNFCSASYLYSDEVYNICAGSYEIIRTWKVRNTCQPVIPGVNPIEAVQIIRVLDFENPRLSCPDDVTISTNSIDCNGAYHIPPPVVETGCTNYTYTVSVSAGDLLRINDGSYVLSGLNEGIFTIRYEVEDECGRYSECIFNITVVDQVGPTASCENGLNVSLNGGGVASLDIEDIDGNSQDLCSSIELAIRRSYEFDPTTCEPLATNSLTEWGQTVDFNCCDLEGLVNVELRVTDENGNTSSCWTEILVEDKITPECEPPADLTITCIDYRESLPNDITEASDIELDAAFGSAHAVDNCGASVSQSVSGSVNSCGIGQLTRVFTATDGVGLTNSTVCTQTINVIGVFDYQLTFPTDESGTCADIPGYEELITASFACDLFAIDTHVDTLRTIDAGDECFKLRVTYDVINWCEYNTLGDPYLIPRDGRMNRDPESQLLYLNVIRGEQINDTTDDLAFLSRFSDRNLNEGAPQRDQLLDNGNDTDDGDDGNHTTEELPYSIDDSRGAFRYVQYIKVYDEVAPVINSSHPTECFSGESEECSATVVLNFTAEDECSTPIVTAQLDLNYVAADGFLPMRSLSATELTTDVTGAFVIRLTGIPTGQHAVRINANDGCGNFDNELIEFCVSPNRAPTPICIQTLTVSLMPDGQGGGIAAIWASDFVASPIADCFGNAIDTYGLYRETTAVDAGFTPTADQLGLTLDCNDYSNGTVPLRLYAFDAAGNSDYCQIVVEVQSNGDINPCEAGGFAQLAGSITDRANNPVEDVVIHLSGSAGLSREMTTPEDGSFSFEALPQGGDYTLTPSHFSNFLNGVRTSDIVGITRHILGVQALDGPYNRLAADVDGNTEINVGDIISIRRLILGLADGFPNDNPSWLFIPSDFAFSQSDNPWAETFPSVSNYNNLTTTVNGADFVGIKLGDINQSAVANARMPAVPRNLRGSLEMETDEVRLRTGETFRIPVSAQALPEVDGYQFTLQFDPTILEVTGIEPGLVPSGNFGWTFAERGLITSSWNWASATTPANWTGEEVLFTLLVQANSDDRLSSGLLLGSQYTPAEAYERNTGQLRDLALVFKENETTALRNELLQNVPNPVRNQTIIGFHLAEAKPEVTVSIRDATGRLVQEFLREGMVGYNSLVVDHRMLNKTAGIYTYTVTAGDWVATRRMIVLK
ncbi:HYR domain-containing protein [Neolewinella agarilytica]|uniref:Por secretion system C-terminal sorting domain-containing protein n=1 Tax=Neolewinella agarilytica TaxID=478744 RepID=A0A1H9MI54_9BACT|nr:HYR domain-containing protein [Neolewinella agarilytica]SER23372.1 Por secretion system C-terminal sorting domain-containing protein [Neolewinella agarilytica]